MNKNIIFIAIIFVFHIFLQSCGSNDATVANLGSVDTGTTTPPASTEIEPNTCNSPSTSVIWKGERSVSSTTSLRGAWSDIQIIPSTTYPATVYTDMGCTCLKYTFWNGTSWVTEIITAAHTTSFTHIRLAFLSSGKPVVVWSNSTTTMQMAIRSTASTSTVGTWSLTTLDTGGTAIQAIEIKINPADQVAILYARNTAGTSHLILCTTGCDNGANYSSPSTTLGTVGTTPRALGLGWCSSGSGYYPVIALTGAANTSYAICRQSTLSSCLTGIASWAGGALQTLTGTGANRASVQLAIDDTTTDAPIRAIANNGAALAIYQSSFAGGGCAAGTVGAIAASGTITGTSANSGNATFALVRTTDGNYHIAANETTTSVRYYNTTTASFGSWNAAGTVATATLAAAGSTRGGLAVDVSLGQAYTTFSRTAAAAPFNANLMFGWVENTTIASNNTSAQYFETPLVLDGQIQNLTNQVPNISVAATASGTPAVAFVDYSHNLSAGGVLKYSFRIGDSIDDNWAVTGLPVVAQPQSVALAFDKNHKPWVAVYDQLTKRFLLSTNTESDGSGIWSTYYFPFRNVVSATTLPAYHSVSIAMNASSTSVRPVMVIGIASTGILSQTGVWAATLNPETGDWSNISQLESTNQANSISNVTTDYDSNGNIVVAYYDRSNAHNRVEYVHSTNGGVSWSTSTAVTSTVSAGAGLKVKLDPSTSRPAVSFFDRINNRVIYANCTTSLSQCDSLVNWSNSYIENLTAGTSTLAVSNDGLLGTGLTFTSSGTAYVTYPIASGNSGSLMLNNNASGTFTVASTLLSGANANTTVNPAMAAVNFAQAGWNVDSVRTSTGAMHSVYVGPGNWLYNTSCGD